MCESLSMTKKLREQQAVASKSAMRKETIQTGGFLEPQGEQQKARQKTEVTAGPQMAMENAPAGKLEKTRTQTPVTEPRVLGRLEKTDRTGTHSDVQRLAFKKNLLQNVAMDGKAKHSRAFKNVLELIKNYASIDVVAGSEKKERDQEMKKLNQIMKALDKALEKVEEKEKKTLLMYKNYFELDTGGYLSVPQTGVLDCTKKVLNGKRKKIPNTDPAQLEPFRPIEMEDKKDELLFPHEPSLNDIVQTGLGDCYLLAALSAVVSRNPQWIKDCMKDLGHGDVVVRLYDKTAGTEGAPAQFDPKYIKVRKQTPKGEPYAAGSLWVQLIEQAYAASEMHKKPGAEGAGYENIEGGWPQEFMERIMGSAVETHEIRSSAYSLADVFQTIHRNSASGSGETFKNIFGVKESQAEGTPADLEVKGLAVVMEYDNYFNTMLKDKQFYSMEEAEKAVADLSYSDLPKFQGMNFNAEEELEMQRYFINKMKDVIVGQFHHKAFSEKYQTEALAVFDEIQKAQSEGKMMTASSQSTFISNSSGTGLNGEGMEDALAANHAYTLLGARQLGQNRYIMIRNPWDKSAREYTQDERTHEISRQRVDKDTHGIYLLELNDFMTHFQDFSML